MDTAFSHYCPFWDRETQARKHVAYQPKGQVKNKGIEFCIEGYTSVIRYSSE